MNATALTTTAAEALGVPAREIADVLESPAGLVVHTTDGVGYIIVPDDQPDADGKTGLMLLAKPTESWSGSFPVFANEPTPTTDPADPAPANPAASSEGDQAPADPAGGQEPAAPPADPVPDGSAAVVLAWVAGDPGRAQAAIDAEQAQEKPRGGLLKDLAKVVEAPPA